MSGIACFLHDGANVDLLVGKRRGDGGDDSRPVFNEEADVMGDLELGAYMGGSGRNLDAAGAMGKSH